MKPVGVLDAPPGLVTYLGEPKLIALIDHDSTPDPFTLTIAMSVSVFPEVRCLGADGVIDHTFIGGEGVARFA